MHSRAWCSAALSLALGAIPAAASAQIVNFGLFDFSEDTRTLVLVRTLPLGQPQQPPPLLSANYTEWQTGSSGSVGYMHRWALTSGGRHSWSVGAGFGLNSFNSKVGADDETGASLRAQTELSGPAPGGTYFALLQLGTFRDSVFALAQYNLDPWRLGFDLSRYEEVGVKQTALAVRIPLDQRKRWSFRVGAIDTDGDVQTFIGVSYNAF